MSKTKVWRLVTHHVDPEAALAWALREGRIAVGWEVGDLSGYASRQAIFEAVKLAYPDDAPPSWSNGATSLYNLYHVMERHDYVILSTGKNGRRERVMEVAGDYECRDTTNIRPFSGDYRHQREAQLMTGLGPDEFRPRRSCSGRPGSMPRPWYTVAARSAPWPGSRRSAGVRRWGRGTAASRASCNRAPTARPGCWRTRRGGCCGRWPRRRSAARPPVNRRSSRLTHALPGRSPRGSPPPSKPA